MMVEGWPYEKLLRNGWYGRWDSPPDDMPFLLTFTYYRSEISIHSVEGLGETEAEAIADAVERANAWLREHPRYQPRR